MGLLRMFKSTAESNASSAREQGAADKEALSAEIPAKVIGHPTSGTNVNRKRILLVGGPADGLEQLLQDLSPMETFWEMRSCNNPAHGLLELEQGPWDAVVASLEMDGVDGLAFLKETAARFPKALRIIRCEAEKKSKVQAVAGAMPQVLYKNADAETLCSSIVRGFRLNAWMEPAEVRTLVGRMRQLPSLPTLYTEVLHELNSPEGSLENVAKSVAKDPVMTAKMLQVVNSAFFSLARQIVDPAEAVMYLGAERTKSLILLAKVFSQFDQTKCRSFSLDEFWQHAMSTGTFAMAIVKQETKDNAMADLAFTTGLLHDVGKLLLAGNVAETYGPALEQAERRKISAREVELEAFGTTHSELGACLLATWGLPVPLLDAIAWHHNPMETNDTEFSITTAVHVANALYYEKRGDLTRGHASKIDARYINHLWLGDRPNLWRKLCGCAPRMGAQDGAGKARTYGSIHKEAA